MANSYNDSVIALDKNLNNLKKDLLNGTLGLDNIEVDIENQKVKDGIDIYTKKLKKVDNNVFDKMFLSESILDIYNGKTLLFKCFVSKKDKGVLVVAYIPKLDEMMMGTYYFDDCDLVAHPTIKGIEKIEEIIKKLKSESKIKLNISITSYCKNTMSEIMAILGYVNALALSDREMVYKAKTYAPMPNRMGQSNKSKSKKSKKNKKVKLIKKFILRPEKITDKDNKELRRRGYIKTMESWNVSGHWRVIRDKKTGKPLRRIWIDGYVKGKGERKTKTYIIE